MDDVLVRARRGDLDTVLPLMRAYAEFDGLAFDETTARRAITQLLTEPQLGSVWLIVIDGATRGYLALCYGFSLELGGRDAFLDELYIEPAWRDRGFGSRALAAAGEVARAEGICALHLEVRRDNADAQRYYERLGFSRRDRYFFMTRRL